MIDHIYRDGRHYDRMFANAEHDLPFWQDRTRRYGDPILE